ncbi:hypothetical protein TWF730_010513 [Orbilia blumenaviensis]|uniref:F-box domain-containing protein n=1 Tax=Orbilia blumenaviensis TaxID=1796055 RepID=A0AAV9UNG5_9PEZI
MGLIPKAARTTRTPVMKLGPLASLPIEILLQIIEDDILTAWDRVCFAASCRRFKDITYPCLYRRFDWIMPFETTCSLGLTSGFGLLVDIFLEPVISSVSTMLGKRPPPDIHKNSFTKRAELVRKMSVLGGYQYYKDMGVLTRYYGTLNNGDSFISIFEPFHNLRSIELDERAALTWTGYLRVIANLLVSKPTLEELTLRHRLGTQPESRCETPADMVAVRSILSKGVVSKLASLTIILGRRFEPTEMGYEYFHQLMEVFEGATNEVTTFKIFAKYSKLDETDPILKDGVIDSRNCRRSSVKIWSFPKLRDLEIHTHNFPDAGAIQSIEKSSLGGARKLKFVCDIMGTDVTALSENLSSFQNIEEISIWDPQWPVGRVYSDEELLLMCEKLSSLKRHLRKLKGVRWVLGYQKFNTECSLGCSSDGETLRSISVVKAKETVEKTRSSLPQSLRYIKEGYISIRS